MKENILGKKFGKLNVIQETNKKTKERSCIWVCKCDCGNVKEVSQANLKKGVVKSCGCLVKNNDFKNNKRKKKNEFVFLKDYVIMKIDSKGLEYDCLIDFEDYETVSKTKWSLDGCGYVRNYDNGKRYRLHRWVLNYFGEEEVDHINGNRLDNRKCNLRICSHRQNCFNNKHAAGVYFEKEREKWCAQMNLKGKHILFGRYDTKEEALKVRKDKEKEFFGEFAKQ